MFGLDRVNKYAFINAKLRARISNILSDELLDRMMKARSLTESIRVLHGTPFQIVEEVYDKTGDLKLAEVELYKKEVSLYLEIEKHLKNEVLDFVQALSSRYEIENLKAILRLWFDRVIRKRNIENSTGYIYREKINYDLHPDEIINTDTIEGVSAVLSSTPYGKIIEENSAKLELTRHLFPIEIALDKYYFRQLHEKAGLLDKTDFEITRKMLGVEIDMENISWLVRFRDFYRMSMEPAIAGLIPYGHHLDKAALESAYTSGDSSEILRTLISKKYSALSSMFVVQSADSQSKLVLLNRMLDQIILYEVKKIKSGYPFNIGIVLAYFVLKKNEIRKVMTILNAKYYNINEDRIEIVR